MALEVVAREQELASVAAFLDEPRTAPGALLLEGEAGIGKSTLWLDASSAGAIEFALRRLDATPVVVLLARRVVDGDQPSGLEQALPAERIENVPVGPLSAGALHRLLHDRLGRAFPRQTLLRIHEQ